MVGRGEQCLDYRRPLRSYGQATVAASRGELGAPLFGVGGVPAFIYDSQFH
jgi:hypothetical protein